jgi:hypothetical protein
MDNIQPLKLRIEALKQQLVGEQDQQRRNIILAEIRDLTASISILIEADTIRLNRENQNMFKAITSLMNKRNLP